MINKTRSIAANLEVLDKMMKDADEACIIPHAFEKFSLILEKYPILKEEANSTASMREHYTRAKDAVAIGCIYLTLLKHNEVFQ